MGKTYGEKPIVFRFEENGEEYMIGSEVLFNFFMNWDFPEVMFLSRNHNEGGGSYTRIASIPQLTHELLISSIKKKKTIFHKMLKNARFS